MPKPTSTSNRRARVEAWVDRAFLPKRGEVFVVIITRATVFNARIENEWGVPIASTLNIFKTRTEARDAALLIVREWIPGCTPVLVNCF